MWKYLNVTQPEPKCPKSKEQLQQQRENERNRKRKFDLSWQKDFPWLVCRENLLFCATCERYETTGSFVKGNKYLRSYQCGIHADSTTHKENVKRLKREEKPTQSEGVQTHRMITAAARNKVKILIRNAHFVAKLGRLYTDYAEMSKLDKMKGIDIGNTYLTDKYFEIFVKSIADSIRLKQNEHFHASECLSIISDGSTDCSSKEAEAIIVRSSAKGKVETHLIGLRHVEKADATHITDAVMNIMNERFDNWKQKFIAMGCDSAAVMLGSKSGVAKQLGERTARPIFTIHCSAHRLELCFKDATKSITSKIHEKCEALMLNRYLFYKLSPLNRASLTKCFKSLGIDVVVPTRVGGTRWLPHTMKAIKHTLTGREAILKHLNEMQDPTGSTRRKDSAAKARNFLKLLQDPEVIVWLHFLMDLVSCLGKVTEIIQKHNVTLAEVWKELQSAKSMLQRYCTSAGPYLRKTEFEGVVPASRLKLLQSTVASIEERFSGDLQFFKSSAFIEFKNWPDSIDGDLGCPDGTVCEKALVASVCELEMVETEWIRFKTDVFNSKRKIVHSLTWSMLWESMNNDYPNLFKLVSLLLTLPSSSVDAERSFRRMKLQKSDWRACLGDRHLTDLMLISLEGEEIENFNPEPALEIWENSGVRSRRPYFNDKEKRKVAGITQEDNDDIQLVNVEYDILADQAEALDIATSMEHEDDEYQYDEQHAKDLITLQQKSYRLLLSLMNEK